MMSHQRTPFSLALVEDARNPAMDTEQLRQKVTDLPCSAAETRPGDVIAFNWHTWHASIGGRDRRQWTVSYGRDPATVKEAERLKEFIDPTNAKRAALSARLRELGIFQAARV
jgi:hypothetical protein